MNDRINRMNREVAGGDDKFAVKTAAATLALYEQQIRYDTTAGAMSVTLPPVAEAKGLEFSIILETDGGPVLIAAEDVNEGAKTITTNITPFVNECYELGTWQMEVAGVRATKVGKVLVADIEEIKKRFPNVDFSQIGEPTLDVLWQIHWEFLRKVYPGGWRGGDFAVYDMSTSENAEGRVIFPHYIPEGHIEPACGTGTVAVGIAIAESGNMLPRNGTAELTFRSGGSRAEIGGPDLTKVCFRIKAGKVIEASFTHSPIEILAVGRLWL